MASMSYEESRNRWRVQFVGVDGKRRSISMRGTRSRDKGKSKAAVLCSNVEELIATVKSGTSLDTRLLTWLESVPKQQYKILLESGLVNQRVENELLKIGPYIEHWLADRLESKKSTIVTWKNAQRNMLEFFGPEKLIRDITIADGESFERWLRKHEKLAEATARKRMQICKQFLSSAIKARIIRENPFDGCKVANRPNPKRQHFVTTEDAQKIMDACSDAEWRCLVALSRYGALRVPSEPRQLRWDDVNWSENVLYVHATKTEHHEDDGDRVVPLFPELRAALNEQWEMAAEGEIYVLPNLRHTTNPLTTLNRIIKRSGVEPFPKAWANMRATRATELQSHFGELLATKWCGHSQRIAKDYYWMQTADDVAKAANWSTEIAVGANRVQQTQEDARNTEK